MSRATFQKVALAFIIEHSTFMFSANLLRVIKPLDTGRKLNTH